MIEDYSEPFNLVNLDVESMRNKIPTFDSNKLCEIIVCERYFGFFPEVAEIAMQELAKRRIAGDLFEFEDYIDNSYNQLPKLNFDILDLRTVLTNAIGNLKK